MNTHEDFNREATVQGSTDRTFGIVFAVFFAVAAVLPLVRGRPIRYWGAALSAIFLVITLLNPGWLSPLNRVWTRFGSLLHKVTNPIVLGILFYAVFTPIGLIVRLCGKDMLRLRPDEHADSYWLPRQPPGPPPESMSRQF